MWYPYNLGESRLTTHPVAHRILRKRMISSTLSSGRHGCLHVNRLSDAFTAMENHGLDEVLHLLFELPSSIRSPSICPATLSDFFSSSAPNRVLSYLLLSGIK
jgi:hypothetical protein